MSPLNQPTTLLATLRAAIVERLSAAEEFAAPNAVPVQDGGRGDVAKILQDQLERRSASLCLVVTCPRMVRGESSPQHLVVTVSVQIYESPTNNWGPKGRNLAIEDAGEAVFLRLNFADDGVPGWSPGAQWTRFVFGQMRPVRADAAQVIFELTFTTETKVSVLTQP